MIDKPALDALRGLITSWRNEAAVKDSFHATMGVGWKACAAELDACLAPLVLPQGPEPRCDACANRWPIEVECAKCSGAIDWAGLGRLDTADHFRDTAKKIHGALKSMIAAHGPITGGLIGSATKRIIGQLTAESASQGPEPVQWQDIASAPKDGSEFIARVQQRATTGTHRLYTHVVAKWNGHQFATCPGSYVIPLTDWTGLPASPSQTESK